MSTGTFYIYFVCALFDRGEYQQIKAFRQKRHAEQWAERCHEDGAETLMKTWHLKSSYSFDIPDLHGSAPIKF